MEYRCTHCGAGIAHTNEAQRYRLRVNGKIFCAPTCGYAHRHANRTYSAPTTVQVPCSECSTLARLTGPALSYWKKEGRGYCSKDCSNAYRARVASKTAAATNRKFAATRMRERNPMFSAEAKARMTRTLRSIGHEPRQRGGNGRPPTSAEFLLWAMLQSEGFVLRAAIKTGMPRGSGYPTTYKPDLTLQSLKVAIEADGASHAGKRRVLDRKKDEFLRGLGWTVLRFTNAQILSDPAAVMMTVLSTTSKLKGSTPT